MAAGGGADARFMALALALGRRSMGRTWPNPAVGCVIVRDGRIVGRGWTAPGGRPHAEPQALAQAGPLARGATAYVTLEPCAHHGKTPPCAAALVAAGVARVVSALEDPDARVAGRGHAMLRDAGIAVTVGPGADVARADHAGFLLRVTDGRPLVTLKLASSFDGRIGTASGESRWITGPAARARVHLMRAQHDAVMVGSGTVRADDPDLGVRGLGLERTPVRVIWDSRLTLDPATRLGRAAATAPVWVCHGPNASGEAIAAWRATGAELLACPVGADGRLTAGGVLAALGARGLTRVFCEGGGMLAATLMAEGLVDRLVGFTAGLVLGADGRAAMAGLPFGALAAFPRFRLERVEAVGGDVLHFWQRDAGSAGSNG
jgi:diaminohydroxyphosphoribosylaminopyrimidine deaminase/5-amino-6-(5-phosphoribosylamino)uracil reductase